MLNLRSLVGLIIENFIRCTNYFWAFERHLSPKKNTFGITKSVLGLVIQGERIFLLLLQWLGTRWEVPRQEVFQVFFLQKVFVTAQLQGTLVNKRARLMCQLGLVGQKGGNHKWRRILYIKLIYIYPLMMDESPKQSIAALTLFSIIFWFITFTD